ncbi:protein FAM156A/FAM156B-like [Ochotona curzoniae]|uniref:protein FAM156A/FAM156B n=1 Tax=Ochotona curzoniae TaxID=130825 RepID=UPI001B34E7DE|nr:protein FAM156A/FAM156B [Ochotona curzoniae]XP_040854465.1 protein FAM156A/FAM156B-like [Ochotona curzoniae]
MDPPPKQSPALAADATQTSTAETSGDGRAACQPPSTEQLVRGLGKLLPRAGPGLPAPLPEGLLQQQYREGKTPPQRQWDRLPVSQRKTAFLGHLRRRHRDHMAPYPVARENRVSPSGDRAQNRFRCECRYCQNNDTSVSGLCRERSGASWETLVQGLSGLSLSLGSSQPGHLPQGALQQQQLEQEEKCQLERHQESKRMFHRLLKQWLDEK